MEKILLIFLKPNFTQKIRAAVGYYGCILTPELKSSSQTLVKPFWKH